MKVVEQSHEILAETEQMAKLIELAGRTCYKSEDKITDDSADKFVNGILKRGHESVIEHGTITVRFITDRGCCYDEKTEILTDNGWKLFKDINDKDLFLTLNFDTGQAEYQNKTNYFEEHYKGEMIGGKSTMVDFLVTPNHRMYYYHYDSRNRKWKIDFADSIFGKRVKFERGLPTEWKGYDFEIQYPNQEKLDFAKFLGLFITDGSKWKGEKSGGKIWIHQLKKKNYSYIRNILNNLNINYNEKEDGFEINNTKLYNFLNYNFTQIRHHDRRVPDWIKNASRDYISSFIEGVIVGDGNIHNKHEVIYTTNKKLADDYQECILKMGFCSSIREDDRVGEKRWNNKVNNFIKNSKKCYIVSITKRTNKHLFNKKLWYRINYDGKVYCVSVPNGIVYIRRNGKSIWSGNSHELVRHRLASYCLPADVEIYSDRNNRNTKVRNIGDLAEMNKSNHGRSRIKLLKLRSMSDDGVLTTGKVTNFVESGNQDVYVIETENGYKLPCTKNHRILTEYGYKRLEEIDVDERIFVNGRNINCSNDFKHVYLDKVTSIRYRGNEPTYDLTVEPYHNFVANGVIVHNSQESTRYCNYGGDHIKFILPVWANSNLVGKWYDETDFSTRKDFSRAEKIWLNSLLDVEKDYHKLLICGWKPEMARSVLPNSLKTEIVMTANVREWRHLFNLRCSRKAHPQIYLLMFRLREELREKYPMLF